MKKLKSALFLSFCFVMLFSTYTAVSAVSLSFADAQNEINNLTPRVDELITRVESSRPTGTMEERHRQFRALDKEIDVLESEIDLLEDKLELSYLSETLSWEEYRSLKRELDKLDDRLDQAEDHLEQIFNQ